MMSVRRVIGACGWLGCGLGEGIALVLPGGAAAAEAGLEAPVAGAATDVNADRFTANWSGVAGATGYVLDVFRYDGVPPTSVRQGFDGYPAAVAEGWTVTNKGGAYTTSGNFGESAPSIKLEEAGHSIVTPVYPAAVTNFSFWHKGLGVSNSFLRAEAHDGAEWMTLAVVALSNKAVAAAFVLNSADGFRRFRLAYEKDKGNVAVDDVSASYGDATQVFVRVNETVGDVTSHTVSNLTPDVYYYRVRATDGEQLSADSNVIAVDLPAASAPPSIAPLAPQSTRVGQTLTFALIVTPTGGDPVTSTNAAASAGVAGAWSLADGQFNYTAASGDVGVRVFSFSAQDKDGISDVVAATVTVRRAQVAAVRMTGAEGAYLQDFDALASNGLDNVWDNAAEPLEAWQAYSDAAAITTYRAGTGSLPNGGLYAFGAEGGDDRSLGSVASAGNTLRYGVAFSNETGSAVTNLAVTYTAEQRRVAASPTPNALVFEYCVTNRVIPLNQGAWRRVNALCFKTPLVTNASQAAGAVCVSAALSAALANPLLPGQAVLLRWSDPDDAGNDHAFGIDDLKVTWVAGAMPEAIPVGRAGVTETFDEMACAAGAEMPFLWRVETRGDAARVSGAYAAGVGRVMNSNASSAFSAAGSYLFSSGTEGDYAVGGLSGADDAKSVTAFAKFRNATAVPVRQWRVRCSAEKYRNGLAGCSVRLLASTDGQTWIAAGAAESFPADADTNGCAPPNGPSETREVERGAAFAKPVEPGGVFYLAWQYAVTEGESTADAQALGIDDVRVVPVLSDRHVFILR